MKGGDRGKGKGYLPPLPNAVLLVEQTLVVGDAVLAVDETVNLGVSECLMVMYAVMYALFRFSS